MKIVLLGGAGNQGLYSTKELIKSDIFNHIVIASRNIKNTQKIVEKLDSPKISTAQVDVTNEKQILRLIADADIIANCTGPYYLLGETVIDAAIKSGKNYIDFCDDIVVHKKVFTEERQRLAKEKGISLIIGLGASPGLLPLIALHGSNLMDSVEDIDLYMAIHSEDNTKGPAVVLHAIENLSGNVFVKRDGEVFKEHPLKGLEIAQFPDPIGEKKVATIGHPEIFSLSRVMDVDNISIKLGTYPTEGFDYLNILIGAGLGELEPIPVGDDMVVPRDFLMSLLSKENKLEVNTDSPLSAMYSEVRGKKDGKNARYKIDIVSQMGPMAGIPLAVAAEMMVKGEIDKKGLMVPEECIDPKPFIDENIKRIKDAGYPIKAHEEFELTLELI